jgi:hypothetical protein
LWALHAANTDPTRITLDPSGASTNIWVVDNGTDTIYECNRDTGAFVRSFALAASNVNPQGINDPPPAFSPVPSANFVV